MSTVTETEQKSAPEEADGAAARPPAEPAPRTRGPRPRRREAPQVAIVAAGAGARGAFEAGALSVLVPWLAERGQRPTIYVGTSAGAINATMLASTAHLSPDKSAEVLLQTWRGITIRKAFHSPLLGLPGTAASYAGQLLGIPGSHVISILDTTPLREYFRSVFLPYADALHENVARGVVRAVANVATSAMSRTVVFSSLAPRRRPPATNVGRAIDYQRVRLNSEHVLASCAIPALFRPVRIGDSYYVDGGVRLNVPLAPAVAFGASHIAVVATHPDKYPSRPPRGAAERQPDLVDAAVALLGSVLADRMVEDLHTLQRINILARAAGRTRSRGPREIRNLFVGPKTRHEIGELAAEVYARRYRGRRAAVEFDFRAIHWLIGGGEPGDGDLLSYLFFDEQFIDRAVELGRRYARGAIGTANPWS